MIEVNTSTKIRKLIMLKPLLFVLTIVTLIALALNFNLFSNSETLQKPIEKSIEKIKDIPKNTKKIITNNTQKNILTDNNLSKELKELIHRAQKLFQAHKDSEALLLYEEVIKKSKDSNEVKILKLFAQACFEKAAIHYVYPNNDIEAAIESYELMIKKFKIKYNKDLLLIYMRARLGQARFTSKDELLVAYDEVIEKFQKDKEKRFEKEIEELLYAKSFALMGVNDEEAIAVLDSLIAKYSDKSNLPDTVKFSILNNIELSIITSNDPDKYIDLANKYMADSPDTKPLLEMLSIVKNSQDLEQDEALEAWNKEHGDYLFPDWDFSELRKWVNKMETPQSQKRVRKYLDFFEKQKYKKIYNRPKATVPVDPTYSDKATQNSTQQEEDYNTIQESDLPVVEKNEEDPYMEEIMESEPEITYPNPYSQSESNEEADGVSHTYQEDDY